MSPRPITSPTPSPAQGCSPILQEQGRRCCITHKPTCQKNNLGKDSEFVLAKSTSLSPCCPVENNPGGFPSRKQSLAASSLNSHLCLCREVQIAPPRAASPGRFILREGKLCCTATPNPLLEGSFHPGTLLDLSSTAGTPGSGGIATAPVFAGLGMCQACSGCTKRDHSLSHLGKRGAECLEDVGIIQG